MENNNLNKLDTKQDNVSGNELIIYQDKYLTITNKDITINSYYMWYPMKKKIKFSMIKRIELINLTLLTGKYKFWGLSYLMYWFHMDSNRYMKKECIVLDLGTCIKPAITPNNILQVYEILIDKLDKR